MKIYILAFLLLFQFPIPHSSPLPLSQQEQKTNKVGTAKIVFKSTDGGQTWQNISEGLPVCINFQQKSERTVFETARGTVFMAYDGGVFKSTNSGKTWKQVHTKYPVTKLVGSNGVLMATTYRGIIRSADDGENWDLVINEGGVGIAIEPIKGGFAAITYNTKSNTRRMRTSYDGGKTWQPIDAGLPAQRSITSIIQVGDNFFCGHPDGIYRSSDKGKTWKLLLPSIKDKVFSLSVSGNVIYAIPVNGGC